MFYLLYAALWARINEYDAVADMLATYYKKNGSRDIFRFIPLIDAARYMGIMDTDMEYAAVAYDGLCAGTGTFAELVRDKNVAVVGNGPGQVGCGTGPEIDSADIVIRFNNFHTDGYAADYGTRTDIWVWGCGGGSLGPNEDKLISDIKLMIWGPHWSHFEVCGDYHRFLYRHMTDAKNKTAFEFFPCDDFYELISHVGGGIKKHPSLGATAIYYLVKHCRPRSVKYYGFSFLNDDAASNFSHYYDNHNGTLNHPHDLDAECRFLKQLIKKEQ